MLEIRFCLNQCFSKWILMGRGAKKTKGGDRGPKQHKGGGNAQPLIDCWVDFSSLILCLRLLLKQFIRWIFTLDRLRARLQCGLFQGCGDVVKMTQLRLRSSSFHEHGSSSGTLGLHEHGSGALFFHGSGFWSFLHINILIVFGFLKLNWKWIKSSTQS